MKKRGFLQISFQWLFAIVVGIFILFLTIYGITRLMTSEQTVQSAELGKQIGVLLNPLETGFESGKSAYMDFPVDTRIYNTCDDFGTFGKQEVRVSQKTFNKWTQVSQDIEFENKYILSKYPVQARRAYLFSKPLELPFKVANVIYMISADDVYCFVDTPKDIEEEIENLNLDNLLTENCSEQGRINVCFNSDTCDINVNYEAGEVEKQDGTLYFQEDALMYAAIFADKEVYECQLKRLMKKLSSLAELYLSKASFISGAGCNTNLNPELELLNNLALSLDNSADIFSVKEAARQVNRINENNAKCKLW
jgi:hypothetical protein